MRGGAQGSNQGTTKIAVIRGHQASQDFFGGGKIAVRPWAPITHATPLDSHEHIVFAVTKVDTLCYSAVANV